MKDNERLLDAIGKVDDDLIPDIDMAEIKEIQKIQGTRRTNGRKIALIGGLAAAACALIIGGVIFLIPRGSAAGPDETTPMKPTEATAVPSGTPEAQLLAAVVYPKMPKYPEQDESIEDPDKYNTDLDKWSKYRYEMRQTGREYTDVLTNFARKSMPLFLGEDNAENKVYSPLSLYLALGMTAEVSDGSSRAQILDALGSRDIDKLREDAYNIFVSNYLDDGLAKCLLANSIWTSNNYQCNPETAAILAQNYYASAFNGDPDSEAYSKLYRDWVNEQTSNLLNEQISDFRFDPRMIMTLASTVDFYGQWDMKFTKENTMPGQFHAKDGDITCDFMQEMREMSYYWGDNFSSILMTMSGNGQMRILLPDEGVTPEELLKDKEAMDFMMSVGPQGNSKFTNVNMKVPKFDVSSSTDLQEGLGKMGVTDIFDSEKADFSPLLTEPSEAFISKAEQDVRVKVDEDGCSAAALTQFAICGAGMPEDQVDFVVDRPFVFEILSESGAPLFIGVVNDPAAQGMNLDAGKDK